MPEIELDPGDYRERRPKGWRWRLPWSHDEDTKTPFVMLLVMIGFLTYIFLHLHELSPFAAFLGALAFGIPAGCMLMLWLRD